MTDLMTSMQMRQLEQTAIQSGKVTGLELMERAGQGVVDSVLEAWPEFVSGERHAVVLCGPGNNGGDGFVIARLLHDLGWSVAVHLSGDPKKQPPDAKKNYDRWTEKGSVSPLSAEAVFAGPRPDLLVDAVFGIGLTRPLSEDLASILEVAASKAWPRSDQVRRVAVDCPSGLNLDLGQVPTDKNVDDPSTGPKMFIAADLTVTFHTPKLGHYTGIGPVVCRQLKVVDIGLTEFDRPGSKIGLSPEPGRVRLVTPDFAKQPDKTKAWPGSHIRKLDGFGHKYDHGHVFVFAGGVGRGGAGRLAARAALRVGAGLVTVLCPPAALIENACQLEAVMLRALGKEQPLQEVADHRVSAFCLGPGMGVSEATKARVIEVLAQRASKPADRPPAVVLDADALTCFMADPAELFRHTHGHTILTPHEGEFARLFPDLSGSVRRHLSKADAVRQAADRAGCVILLKGPDTVIAAPHGGVSVHASVYGREAPWLATAGAGDVLAGLIAGLSAPRGNSDLFQLAEIAAYLHVEAARRFGPGLIAEDLPEQLPHVLRDLG